MEELRKTVVESLRKVFDFSRLKLKEKLVDREGNAITASGPAISVAASDPGSCSKSLWELHRLYVKADERLNKAKPTFKQGEDPQGGVQVQADRIAGLSLDSFLKDLRNFAAGEAREKAAEALRNLATNADNEIAIAQAGAIFSLVELLSCGTPVGQENAAAALGNLTNDDNQIAIAKAGAIPPLVELLSRGTPVGQEKTAGALWGLAVNSDNKIAIAKAGAIPPLVELLSRSTPVGQENAAATLSNLAVNSDNQIPPLVELLSRGTPVGQENAAAALGSLTNDDNQIAIAKAGAIPPLVELLSRVWVRKTPRQHSLA